MNRKSLKGSSKENVPTTNIKPKERPNKTIASAPIKEANKKPLSNRKFSSGISVQTQLSSYHDTIYVNENYISEDSIKITQTTTRKDNDDANNTKKDVPLASESKETLKSIDSDWFITKPSYIKIDFTMTEEDKLDYEKVEKFWDLVDSNDELKQLIVYPLKEEQAETSESEMTYSVDGVGEDKEPIEIQSVDSFSQYEELILDEEKIRATLLIKNTSEPSCFNENDTEPLKMDKTNLKKLNKDMNEFDLKNPKSFEPPGRAPDLIKATLQRHPQRGVIPNSDDDIFIHQQHQQHKHHNTPNTG